MNAIKAQAPLAEFAGARPAAPAWFEQAIAQEPGRSFTEVAGARIETLCWGPADAPGLFFLQGNGAHADWWTYIAPFFSEARRVVALSFSGMGGSDWRSAYSSDAFVEEVEGVAAATSLLDGRPAPVLVGHSMGAAIALACTDRFGERLSGAVLVDPPFLTPQRMQQWRERREAAPARTPSNRVYPDLATALSRYRLMPPQTVEHPYIVDHIARASLKQAGGGWTWRFDPQLWSKMAFSELGPLLAHPKCPIALMHGDRSRLANAEDLAHMWETAPKGTPVVMIPDADHHLMIDQPLAFVAALRGLLAGWPKP